MIKCETIEKFNIANFGALKNIKRAGVDKEGTLFIGDTFECDEDMAKYLTGENVFKRAFVKVIEIEPKKVKDAIFEEVKEDPKEEVKEEPKKKTIKKSTKSKK